MKTFKDTNNVSQIKTNVCKPCFHAIPMINFYSKPFDPMKHLCFLLLVDMNKLRVY